MESNEIKKLVSSTKEDINKLNTTLTELQKTCTHKEIIIKNVSSGVTELRKVCKTCDKELGYPNPKELKESGY